MKTHVYTMFDSATKVFHRPFHQLSDAEAIRTCRRMVNDDSTDVSHAPYDWVLFKLGEYEDTTGVFTLLPAPERMCVLSELLIVNVSETSKVEPSL